MIKSFKCKHTEKLWQGYKVRCFPADIQDRALVKLRLIDAATSIEDLKVPPGNRLEQLKGDREGSFSIRINAQWRICFLWEDVNAFELEIVDYH